MKSRTMYLSLLMVCAFVALCGCQGSQQKSPDVSNQIRNSLDQAGLKDVRVSQDRDKGVVTLKGSTNSDADRAQAESIAKSIASNQVIANEIAVKPPQDETAGTVNSDTDKGIEKNLDAALVKSHLKKGVSYDVKNGVVTLKGKVNSQSQRAAAEKAASDVPNVRQVVNELEVRNQKATSKRATS